MPNSFHVRVTMAPEVLFRELSGEAVLLNLKTQCYLGLNPLGTRMWEVLMQADSIETAYKILLAEYDVSPDRLEQDVTIFVEKLRNYGLVELAPAGSVPEGSAP